MLMFWLAEEWQELYHVSINAGWCWWWWWMGWCERWKDGGRVVARFEDYFVLLLSNQSANYICMC